MKTLGIVPARKGSTRFPDKHHAVLLGKPMFAYTLEAAVQAKSLDRIVVSSDDMALKPLAEHYGVEFMERPAELCTAEAALDDALRHVCRCLSERDGWHADVVISMQGNVPIRKPGQIATVLERFHELPDATAVCTAREERLRPEWAKVIINDDTGEVAPFLPGYTGYRNQDYARLFMLDGAICGVRVDTLFAHEHEKMLHAWLGKRLHIVMQEHPMYSLEVDYPDEMPLATFYLLYQRFGDQWCQRLDSILV